MTLDTRIVIEKPLGARRVFDQCRKLIGADHDGYQFRHVTEPGEYDAPAHFNPGYLAQLGQGYPALLWMHYGPDGPLRRYEDDDETPEGFIEVSFDTAYGSRTPRGGSCSDLHAWLVRELGHWLDEQGATWSWQNEFTGEWFQSYDGLDALGNANRGALA